MDQRQDTKAFEGKHDQDKPEENLVEQLPIDEGPTMDEREVGDSEDNGQGSDNTDPPQEDRNADSSDEEQSGDQSKYQEGQPVTFIRVRFPGNAKSFPFAVGRRNFQYGQKVVAMSDRGMAVGYINSFPYEMPFKKSMLPIRYINKIATDEDIEREQAHIQKEKNAEEISVRLIEKHKLDMNLTHVEFTQFGKKAVFYFNAPSRVDFRGLVKDLVSELKMRIELRQISVRDRSAAIGGIGPCGRQLCCSSFLQKYGNVGIKMAKNQNLSLTQNKINGVCGQLKCCLQYEDNVYTKNRKELPKENSMVKLANGDQGKVLRLHVLAKHFDVLTDEGKKRRYHFSQYDSSIRPADDYQFPQRFDHVADETINIIGLEDDPVKVPKDSYEFDRGQTSENATEQGPPDEERSPEDNVQNDDDGESEQKSEEKSSDQKRVEKEKRSGPASRSKNHHHKRNRNKRHKYKKGKPKPKT